MSVKVHSNQKMMSFHIEAVQGLGFELQRPWRRQKHHAQHRHHAAEKTCQVKRPVEDAPSFQSFVQRRFWAMVKPPEAEVTVRSCELELQTLMNRTSVNHVNRNVSPNSCGLAGFGSSSQASWRGVPPMWLGQESRNQKSPQSNSQEMSSVSRPHKIVIK